MSKEQFLVYNMKPDSLMMIKKCNDIIDEYQAQGLVLTLRQLYYQTVAKNIIENTQRSYVDNYDSVVEYLKRQ